MDIVKVECDLMDRDAVVDLIDVIEEIKSTYGGGVICYNIQNNTLCLHIKESTLSRNFLQHLANRLGIPLSTIRVNNLTVEELTEMPYEYRYCPVCKQFTTDNWLRVFTKVFYERLSFLGCPDEVVHEEEKIDGYICCTCNSKFSHTVVLDFYLIDKVATMKLSDLFKLFELTKGEMKIKDVFDKTINTFKIKCDLNVITIGNNICFVGPRAVVVTDSNDLPTIDELSNIYKHVKELPLKPHSQHTLEGRTVAVYDLHQNKVWVL